MTVMVARLEIGVAALGVESAGMSDHSDRSRDQGDGDRAREQELHFFRAVIRPRNTSVASAGRAMSANVMSGIRSSPEDDEV